jgi:hypothetical protein
VDLPRFGDSVRTIESIEITVTEHDRVVHITLLDVHETDFRLDYREPHSIFESPYAMSQDSKPEQATLMMRTPRTIEIRTEERKESDAPQEGQG